MELNLKLLMCLGECRTLCRNTAELVKTTTKSSKGRLQMTFAIFDRNLSDYKAINQVNKVEIEYKTQILKMSHIVYFPVPYFI